MKKQTTIKVIVATALAAAVLVVVGWSFAARSYAECVVRVLDAAPPTDSRPPAAYVRMQPMLWRHRDLYLARMLARECGAGGSAEAGKVRQFVALSVVKAGLGASLRERLGSVFLPARNGRGLTQLAQEEWGRIPHDLNDKEMAWLFVVGARPNCSKSAPNSESASEACVSFYESVLVQIAGPDSPAAPR